MTFSPPSVLPDISPSRGEIGITDLARSTTIAAKFQNVRSERIMLSVRQSTGRTSISPLEGEMPGRAEGGNTPHKQTGGFPSC
jgi:hypothetical protein